MSYPIPTTPLPWTERPRQLADVAYAIHTANAFPHLVAALEEIAKGNTEATKLSLHALAISRGEMQP